MEVWVSVRGEQLLGGENDITELAVAGTLCAEQDALLLTYREEAAGVTVHMRVTDTAVLLERHGQTVSRMHLEAGRRHECRYDTGYGIMPLDIYTTHLHNALTPTGGDLSLRYTMGFGGNVTAEQTVRVQVRPL